MKPTAMPRKASPKMLVAGIFAGAFFVGVLSLFSPFRDAVRFMIPFQCFTVLNGLRLGYQADHAVRISSEDGVVLAASLYLPKSPHEKMPAILIRGPYGRLSNRIGLNTAEKFVPRGYAVLVVDLRGTFDSGGDFLPYEHATRDGVAILDWITKQTWSNGRVGTFGCSALGETQFSLARAGHEAHRAMIAMGAGGGMGAFAGHYGYFGVFEGGIFQLASGFGWFSEWGWARPEVRPTYRVPTAQLIGSLPISRMIDRISDSPNGFRFFVSTALDDPSWKRLDYFSDGDRLDAPAILINTWGDQTVGETLHLAEKLRLAQKARAATLHTIIAPGNHCDHEETAKTGQFGDLPVENAGFPFTDTYQKWFDHHLKGIGLRPALPNYLYYVIGEGKWRNSTSWPPSEASLRRWHLSSLGHANGRNGDGVLRPLEPQIDTVDSFRNDPLNPVPSHGGPMCCTGSRLDRAGPVDQAEVESRSDVLVYTSAPLAQALRIAGPLRAVLTISSSAPDTDFVARLVHVWPNGRATNIQEGALRARYRFGISSPKPLIPGKAEQIIVDMRSIAYFVPAGHRLRLTISSTSFPRLERNLNTGGRNFQESAAIVAENRLYHGPRNASWIELPVIP